MLLRLMEGGRVSLAIGAAAALTAAALGTLVGLLAGYAGGWTDRIAMRATDAIIALPLLPLLIVLAALDLGKLGVPPALAQSDAIGFFRILVLACSGRLDDGGAARARRDAGDATSRFRAGRAEPRRRHAAHSVDAYPAERAGAAGGRDDAERRRGDPARIRC